MYICILKGICLVNRHWFFHIPCTLLSFETLTISTIKTCRALNTNKDVVVVVVVGALISPIPAAELVLT